MLTRTEFELTVEVLLPATQTRRASTYDIEATMDSETLFLKWSRNKSFVALLRAAADSARGMPLPPKTQILDISKSLFQNQRARNELSGEQPESISRARARLGARSPRA